MKKLARSHWESRPQRLVSRMHTEERRVFRLVGGRRVESGLDSVTIREVWKDGPCRHVVLRVVTRGRAAEPCPDCSAPPDDSVPAAWQPTFGIV